MEKAAEGFKKGAISLLVVMLAIAALLYIGTPLLTTYTCNVFHMWCDVSVGVWNGSVRRGMYGNTRGFGGNHAQRRGYLPACDPGYNQKGDPFNGTGMCVKRPYY